MINILGLGRALPQHKLDSEQIDIKYGYPIGTTEKITGLKARHILKEQNADELILQAINEALEKSNLSVEDIDCIINASASMHQAIPFNAAYTHKLLNANINTSAFDINMTCLGALRAFEMASNLLDSYKNILIVTCDVASAAIDYSNIKTAGIFGDGASAMIVSKAKTGGIITSNFQTHSSGYEYCQIQGGGHKISPKNSGYEKFCYFEMNGKKLYKLSRDTLPPFIHESLARVNLCLDDIDWIVPHQASASSLEHIIRILKLDKNKLINIFKTHANQVASSLPSALYSLFYEKDLKSKQKVLMVGTSAGVGLGLVLWEMP